MQLAIYTQNPLKLILNNKCIICNIQTCIKENYKFIMLNGICKKNVRNVKERTVDFV